MNSPKVRVENVVGEGRGYREPAMEQRVSADARTGLTRRWRKFPAFVAHLLISFATYLSVASAVIAIVTGVFLFDEEGSWSQVQGLVFFALLTPILWVGGQRLSRRRHKWRNARSVHAQSVLTIGHDVLRFDGRVVNKDQVERVRVKTEKSRVEVRFNIVLDVEGAKSITALESLEEHEVADVLAAFREGGLEVDR